MDTRLSLHQPRQVRELAQELRALCKNDSFSTMKYRDGIPVVDIEGTIRAHKFFRDQLLLSNIPILGPAVAEARKVVSEQEGARDKTVGAVAGFIAGGLLGIPMTLGTGWLWTTWAISEQRAIREYERLSRALERRGVADVQWITSPPAVIDRTGRVIELDPESNDAKA
jgi:hypothetical protein